MNYFCIILSVLVLFFNSSFYAVTVSDKSVYYSDDKFSINKNLVERLDISQIESNMLEILLQLMLQGQQYFELGLYQDALDSFTQLNRVSPNNSHVLYYMAVSEKKLGRLNDAKKYYNLAVKYDVEFNQFDYVFYPERLEKGFSKNKLNEQLQKDSFKLNKIRVDNTKLINDSNLNIDLSEFWFKDDFLNSQKINYLIKHKHVNSNRPITRQEFIKYAYAFFDFKTIDLDQMTFSNNIKLFQEKSKVNKFINNNKKLFTLYSTQSRFLISDLKKSDDSFLFVQLLLKKGVFWLLRNNYYYPHKQMKRIDAVVIIVRYLNLKNELILNSNVKLPYKDIKRSYWGRKYIEIAYQNDLILTSEKFYPDRLITKSELFSLFFKLPTIKNRFGLFINEDTSIDSVSESQYIVTTNINTDAGVDNLNNIAVKQETIKSTVKLEGSQNVIEESSHAIGSMPHDTLNEKVINNESSNAKLVQLDRGSATQNIKSETDLSLINQPVFVDLDNHWFKITALQLQQMNYLEAKEFFEPKKIMTRLDFINYIRSFFDLENLNSDLMKVSNNTNYFKENSKVNRFIKRNKQKLFPLASSPFLITDFNKDDPNYLFVDSVLKTGIFWLFSDNYFYPKNKMKLIDVIVIIVRYLNFKNELILNSNVEFPYKDIKKSYWGRRYIEIAYENNLISKNNYFYPNRIITKAELIALLAKLPTIQKKLAKVSLVQSSSLIPNSGGNIHD